MVTTRTKRKRRWNDVDFVKRHARAGFSVGGPTGSEIADSRIRVVQPDGSILRAGPQEIHGSVPQEDGAPTSAEPPLDPVDVASRDSFPASDAPSWWSGAPQTS
ncbi:MAG: hypothetical protein ACRDKT_18150 [Actinomycetota bacterium]